jgi:Asp-tRNA(Asn)/Glu-tRNA(Gln) amidotransferase A subunit family amidase
MSKAGTEEFDVAEIRVRDYHFLIREGTVTCEEVVGVYLDRIAELDKSTGLNSMVIQNPNALARARELDIEYKSTGQLRALHGVPVIVKDNYDTHDLQTAAGSLAMKGSMPPDDAYQVRKLRGAGAVILGKSNMAEWAFSPFQTVSSIAGTTRNPYDLSRVPAGSSGGTAAAVAANLGMIGLGTDTGNSIRGPSSHCNLVGIRSTMGLTSRDGIIPLYLRNDVGGPMCRTVEDAVRVLDVIAGYDEADPITRLSEGKMSESYLDHLRDDGLTGKRIGVLRYYTNKPSADPQVAQVFEEAIETMKERGAVMVDPFIIQDFDELCEGIWCNTFRRDLAEYLKSLKNPRYSSAEEIYGTGLHSAYIEDRLRAMAESEPDPGCGDVYSEPKNIKLRDAVTGEMDRLELDVIIYPTWSNPPRKIGDMESPAGDNSQRIPPHTGMPGITVPMGYTYKDLPAGLQIVGRLFREATLIEIAYAYEQSTMHRMSPEGF